MCVMLQASKSIFKIKLKYQVSASKYHNRVSCPKRGQFYPQIPRNRGLGVSGGGGRG